MQSYNKNTAKMKAARQKKTKTQKYSRETVRNVIKTGSINCKQCAHLRIG